MSDWRAYYMARNWDALDTWWRHCDELTQLRAFRDQLRTDLPGKMLFNGMEQRLVDIHPRDAAPDWKGAAEILFLGELEAKIEGEPPTEMEIWYDLRAEVSAVMQAMLGEDKEPTQGDAALSRSAHAKTCLAYFDQLDLETAGMLGELDPQNSNPEDQEWLRAVIAQAALAAFRAGAHAQAANGKVFEAHAVRGKKVHDGAKMSGAGTRSLTAKRAFAVLRSMNQLIAQGHTIRRAAYLTAEKGTGSSGDANSKIYDRRKGAKYLGHGGPLSPF